MSKVILNGVKSVMHALLLLRKELNSCTEIIISGVESSKRFFEIRMEIFELGIDKWCKILF